MERVRVHAVADLAGHGGEPGGDRGDVDRDVGVVDGPGREDRGGAEKE